MNRRSFLKATAAACLSRYLPSRATKPEPRVVQMEQKITEHAHGLVITRTFWINDDLGAFPTTPGPLGKPALK